jgi:hypothetical protein
MDRDSGTDRESVTDTDTVTDTSGQKTTDSDMDMDTDRGRETNTGRQGYGLIVTGKGQGQGPDNDTDKDRDWDPAEIYADHTEMFPEGYDTSQIFVQKGQMSLKKLFRRVWYPGEICSEGPDTPGKFVQMDLVPRGNLIGGVSEPAGLFTIPQNHFKKLWEPANPFKGTLFQNCLQGKTTLPKAKTTHA